MVANLIRPSVMTSGLSAGDGEVTPLQPNHRPPVWPIAASSPTASPPLVVPFLGREMRLDTHTSRFIDIPRDLLMVSPEEQQLLVLERGLSGSAASPCWAGIAGLADRCRRRRRTSPRSSRSHRGSASRA